MLERELTNDCPRCDGHGVVTPKARGGSALAQVPCSCPAGQRLARRLVLGDRRGS